MALTGGQLLAQQLDREGVTEVFSVPGVQLDWAVEAIRQLGPRMRYIVPRHEQATSYMADGGHGNEDYPAMLVGKAGGSIKPGRHVAFQKNTPVSNLYVEMLDRMGAKVDSFGDSLTSKNAAYSGRLPDLG